MDNRFFHPNKNSLKSVLPTRKPQSEARYLQCKDAYVKDNALDVARPPRPD